MWRSKKFILIAVLVALVLVGSVTGVTYAHTKSQADSQAGVLLASDNASQSKALLARVASILGVDQQKLENAFAQAQRDMQAEALDKYLQNLVDQGKITKEQADQYKQWWQSRPDMTQYEQQLKEWQQARPDVLPPGPFGRSGLHRFPGGLRMR